MKIKALLLAIILSVSAQVAQALEYPYPTLEMFPARNWDDVGRLAVNQNYATMFGQPFLKYFWAEVGLAHVGLKRHPIYPDITEHYAYPWPTYLIPKPPAPSKPNSPDPTDRYGFPWPNHPQPEAKPSVNSEVKPAAKTKTKAPNKTSRAATFSRQSEEK